MSLSSEIIGGESSSSSEIESAENDETFEAPTKRTSPLKKNAKVQKEMKNVKINTKIINSVTIDPVLKPMGIEDKPYLDKFRHLIKKHVHFGDDEIFEMYNSFEEKVILQKT